MNYEVYLALVQKKQPMCMFVESEFGRDCIIIPKNHPVIFFTSFCWILNSDRILGVRKSIKDMEKCPKCMEFWGTRNESFLDLLSLSQMLF